MLLAEAHILSSAFEVQEVLLAVASCFFSKILYAGDKFSELKSAR
jgi:hypothetical protein